MLRSLPIWSTLPRTCGDRPPCPGCPRYGDPSPPAEAVARLEQLGSRLGAPAVKVHSAVALGYRHRVRLSARRVHGRVRLGIFEEGSHRLVPIARCPLHHPALIRVAQSIESAFEACGITAYNEAAQTGLVRAVQLCAGFGANGPDAGRVQVTLVVREPTAVRPLPGSPFHQVLDELAKNEEVQSVWVNLQDRPTNTLLGPSFQRAFGEEFLQQECLGALNFFPPGAFGQSHPALHAAAVRAISSFVPPQARVVEYHAGVGSIGLAMAARDGSVASLVANEVNPHGLRGLERGVRELQYPDRVQIVPGEARAHGGLASAADVVIVDPPRKGLEPELLQALVQARPARIVYLSCGLDALVREAEVLHEARFAPIHIAAYPYFPFTDHVETLMVWDRESSH